MITYQRKIGLVVICLIILLFLYNCTNKYSKDNYIATFQVKEGIYEETFQIYSGGVYAGDSYTSYITDSVNFRKLIGVYDDGEMMLYKINDQFIDVYKSIRGVEKLPNGGLRGYDDTIKITSYNIDELIRQGKFE
ncbi:MAG: hypothetical protein KBA86_01645 [Bacteroidales bacterium]|nr:hypothetical protein [Bacteroidales bacterium]